MKRLFGTVEIQLIYANRDESVHDDAIKFSLLLYIYQFAILVRLMGEWEIDVKFMNCLSVGGS